MEAFRSTPAFAETVAMRFSSFTAGQGTYAKKIESMVMFNFLSSKNFSFDKCNRVIMHMCARNLL